jgi:tetratricopeptide (TPR) repeat protein
VLMNTGAVSFNVGELDRADAALAEALELGKVMFASEPVQLAYPTMLLGMIAVDREQAERGRALCAEAVRTAAAADANHPDLSQSLSCLVRALRKLKRPVEALAEAERALRIADAQPIPDHRLNARIGLARVLGDLGRDRPRRRALVREALALDEIAERRARIEQEFRADLR